MHVSAYKPRLGSPVSLTKGTAFGMVTALAPNQAPKNVGRRLGSAVRCDGNESTVLHFNISAPGEDTLWNDVLEVPNLFDQLSPRPSPFITTNNFGGGFVSNEDRVALTALRFASADSAGAQCMAQSSDTEYSMKNPVPPFQSIMSADPGITADDSDSYFPDEFPNEVCVPLPTWAYRAGARETIFMNPKETKVAVVTCGGLCPGLNDVVQGLVNKCTDYGVPSGNILGIRYGFKGFYDKASKPLVLTKESVDGIHLEGGTILGTSRGGADIRKIVKQIDIWGIDICFVVGGNGGNAGAAAIQAELARCRVPCSVIGVPKSIDNDILLIDKCFGFDTAVEEAQRALISAKVEASSAFRGVGIVKVMGRQSGFIAVNASISSGMVDVVSLININIIISRLFFFQFIPLKVHFFLTKYFFVIMSILCAQCLIPEVPFKLHGENGMFAYLEKVLAERGNVLICVAEGAGQDLMINGEQGTDASGNPILQDVGIWMKNEIKKVVKDVDIKYIDPSYIIRSIPTTSGDRIYCKILAHNAVHAAFSGFTGVVVGLVNTHYVLLPIPVVIQAPRRVDPRGKQWNRLRASIGQPNFY